MLFAHQLQGGGAPLSGLSCSPVYRKLAEGTPPEGTPVWRSQGLRDLEGPSWTFHTNCFNCPVYCVVKCVFCMMFIFVTGGCLVRNRGIPPQNGGGGVFVGGGVYFRCFYTGSASRFRRLLSLSFWKCQCEHTCATTRDHNIYCPCVLL